MAKRLVAHFKEGTLEVIEGSIERLQEVAGIGDKRVDMIKAAWEEQKDIRDVMIFLQGQGVSPAYAVKIYKQYGKESVRVVTDNPYRLATDIFGVGFLTADRIAEKLGMAKDSPMRAEAGILHVLNQLSDEGHVYYPYGLLVKKCADVLEVQEDVLPPAFERIAREKKIVMEGPAGLPPEDLMPVYLARLHVSETGVAAYLKTLMGFPKQLRLINLDEAIDWVQRDLKIGLSGSRSMPSRPP